MKQNNVKKVMIKAEFKGKFSDVKKACEKLGFEKIEHSKKGISVRTVERKDLKGKPHLYFDIKFMEKTIELSYNITKEVNEKLRDLEMVKLLLRIAIYFDMYKIRYEDIYKYILKSFEEVTQIVDLEYDGLMNKYENVKNDFAGLSESNRENMKIIEKLNKTMLELEKRNAELGGRVKKLEAVSDKALQEEILEWLKMNKGVMNTTNFSKAKGMSQARVEEGLDMLLKGGYIEKK